MILKNRKGFTLMELLIYMGIVGVIVIIAGEAFSNSTNFRIRVDNMIKASEEAENAANLFKEDVAQMGAKTTVATGEVTGSGDDRFMSPYDNPYIQKEERNKYRAIHDSVYIDADTVLPHTRDSSSFKLSILNGQSDLTLRRIRYTDAGLYKAVEEVRWYVDSKARLMRSCRTIIGTTDGADNCLGTEKSAADAMKNAVVMATDVLQFEVIAAQPTVWEDSVIFPSVPYKMDGDTAAEKKYFRLIPRVGDGDGSFKYKEFLSVVDGIEHGIGTKVSLSDFAINYDEENNEAILMDYSVNQAIAVNPPLNDEGVDPDNWQDFCRLWGGPKNKKLTLQKNATYEISFEMPYDKPFVQLDQNYDVFPFVPGQDHMSIGFRDSETGTIPKLTNGQFFVDDFMFYPPYNKLDPALNKKGNGESKRIMRFTVPEELNSVCLALTFVRYSPKRAKESVVNIRNLRLTKIAGVDYKFVEGFNPEKKRQEKKYIRALKLKLQVSRGAKKNQSGTSQGANSKQTGETGSIDVVIPIPSNGPRH